MSKSNFFASVVFFISEGVCQKKNHTTGCQQGTKGWV